MKIDDFLYKNKIPLLNSALDTYALRMTTAAKNIANVNTVGYKSERVRFEELFSEQLEIQGKRTNVKHIPVGRLPDGTYDIQERQVPQTEIMKSGENDLDIDKEMSEVAQTQIKFQFASQSVNKYFKLLGAAITGNANF